jgi:hypothetical protein
MRGTHRRNPRPVRIAALVAVALLVAAPVLAAGTTTVTVRGDDRASVSETVTVDVVVTAADGGVGAQDLTVELSDPTVASITGAEASGDPGLETVEVADDGSSVRVRAALMNTSDSGTVTLATVTVRGESAGETRLSPSVNELGDESGVAYETETDGANLTVEPATTPPTDTATRTVTTAVRESPTTPTDAPTSSAPPQTATGPTDSRSGLPVTRIAGGAAVVVVVVLVARRWLS